MKWLKSPLSHSGRTGRQVFIGPLLLTRREKTPHLLMLRSGDQRSHRKAPRVHRAYLSRNSIALSSSTNGSGAVTDAMPIGGENDLRYLDLAQPHPTDVAFLGRI